jgi:hypothetical protein
LASVKNLHTVSAVIELGAGLALLCCPSVTVSWLVGVALTEPAALTTARVGGAGLLALGVACWFARADTHSRAARGLIAAMLLYNVSAAGILAYAGIGYGLRGVALWPAAVLHALLSIWCAAYLRASRLSATSPGAQ